MLERSDCDPWPVTVSVSRFCRDPRHLWVLLRPPLERAHLGYGVVSLTLTATRAGRLVHQQHGHRAIQPNPDADVARELAAALDVLENRLGHHAVRRFTGRDDHLPERAVASAPASAANANAENPARRSGWLAAAPPAAARRAAPRST